MPEKVMRFRLQKCALTSAHRISESPFFDYKQANNVHASSIIRTSTTLTNKHIVWNFRILVPWYIDKNITCLDTRGRKNAEAKTYDIRDSLVVETCRIKHTFF